MWSMTILYISSAISHIIFVFQLPFFLCMYAGHCWIIVLALERLSTNLLSCSQSPVSLIFLPFLYEWSTSIWHGQCHILHYPSCYVVCSFDVIRKELETDQTTRKQINGIILAHKKCLLVLGGYPMHYSRKSSIQRMEMNKLPNGMVQIEGYWQPPPVHSV